MTSRAPPTGVLLVGITPIEQALKAMIDGAEMYCKAIKDQNDWIIGEDYVLGAEMESILSGLAGLLNGPGRFDGGTIDKAIGNIANEYKIKGFE